MCVAVDAVTCAGAGLVRYGSTCPGLVDMALVGVPGEIGVGKVGIVPRFGKGEVIACMVMVTVAFVVIGKNGA